MMRLKTCIGNVIIYDTGSECTMTKWIYFSRPDPTKEFVLDSGVKRRITRKLRGTDYQIITLDMAEGQTEPIMDQNLLSLQLTTKHVNAVNLNTRSVKHINCHILIYDLHMGIFHV